MADSTISSLYIPNTFGANSFFLNHNEIPIFYKEFEASDDAVVDTVNNIIAIPEHFYNSGETLQYICPVEGIKIGISTTSPGNTLGTSFLPDEVYPIVVDSKKIRLAFTRDLALQDEFIILTDLGSGTHAFKCEKENTKCLITIDNIIQSPISIASTTQILDIINSNTLELGSLVGITPGTILKISDEYTKVVSVKYNDNNAGVGTVTVLRGKSVLGTQESVWGTTTTYATVMSGQYNIVDDKIYFTDSPFEGKKYNYDVSITDFSQETYSVSIFDSKIKTGSLVGIITQNPPEGIEGGKLYYAIKNYDNNFSFADTYANSIAGTKVQFNLSAGQYNTQSPPGDMTISMLDYSGGSTFYGRAFLRSNYSGNLVFDDISEDFTGITSSFELKSSGVSTIGIASDNGILLINNIFQYPEFEEAFIFEEDTLSGITSVRFIGIGTDGDSTKDYDVNVKGYPRGGIVVGYGLSGGINYQPLRGAKLYESGTLPVVGGYKINSSNIGIAYSGSGYRTSAGYAVSVYFEQDGERISGYGTAIVQNGNVVSIDILSECVYDDVDSPPEIVIDPPLQYEDIELTGSATGIGAKCSFTILDSGEIGNFRFTNRGYNYSVGDVLNIPTAVGTSTQAPGEVLNVLVLDVAKDTFSAWNLGNLRKLDDLTSFVTGSRRTFNLMENGQLVSIESLPGSPIDLNQVLLVFVNDVLQIPGKSYTFDGGTQIILNEAPAQGSTLKVYFYTGSDGDTVYYDIDPKIKVGDSVLIKKNIEKYPQTQIKRTVKRIVSSDKLKTEIYNRKGLSYDSITYRPINMTPQKQDLIIGGEIISKSRDTLKSIESSFIAIVDDVGTFSFAGVSTVAISTSGVQIGDYVESIFTEYNLVTSIGEGVVGFSGVSSNNSPTSTAVTIWRKI